MPLSRTLVALGQIAPAQSAEIDFALTYLYLDERRYRSDTAYSGTGLHGTDALDGDYSMHAHMVGLGLVQVF